MNASQSHEDVPLSIVNASLSEPRRNSNWPRRRTKHWEISIRLNNDKGSIFWSRQAQVHDKPNQTNLISIGNKRAARLFKVTKYIICQEPETASRIFVCQCAYSVDVFQSQLFEYRPYIRSTES
ncbi:hypothetical protein BDBG_04582 [Blastomyces gilchristii SLH14081]|uniref:Uncharacterized protein n=1 Tax=Blastomyces gilchristii (strain SLH14081) TaxID=559298 RepID=A0A179UMG1_BLAGS|nr:uncharacterized protein BDBG_04582 [Blastomyces gilchristii SLH14081]OAT09003.1 hypothetical protein BDBG_04582 [Blastomyces gilchristii SLH14081]